MNDHSDRDLPDWGPLVLAHAHGRARVALDALIRLDQRMARIVATATEPALAQIRMAWWREEVGKERPVNSRPPPDPLLADLQAAWAGHSSSLVGLIDGWEALLDERPWAEEAREQFASGREGAFSGFARLASRQYAADAAGEHGRCWALADLSTMDADGSPHSIPALPRLPSELRSLAVLGGLSRRALKRGGRPLFGDRLSPFAALRLGIFGT